MSSRVVAIIAGDSVMADCAEKLKSIFDNRISCEIAATPGSRYESVVRKVLTARHFFVTFCIFHFCSCKPSFKTL